MTRGWGASLSLRRMLARMYPEDAYTIESLWEFSHSDNPRGVVRQGIERGLVRQRGSQWALTPPGELEAERLRKTGCYPVLPPRAAMVRPQPLPHQSQEPENPRKSSPVAAMSAAQKMEAGLHPFAFLTSPQIRLLRRLHMFDVIAPVNKRTTDVLLNYGMVCWLRPGVLSLTERGERAVRAMA